MTFSLFMFLEVNTPDAYVSSALFIDYFGFDPYVFNVILHAYLQQISFVINKIEGYLLKNILI